MPQNGLRTASIQASADRVSSDSVNDQRRFSLAQKYQAQRVIDIGIREKNARDRTISWRPRTRLQIKRPFDLLRQVRRRID